MAAAHLSTGRLSFVQERQKIVDRALGMLTGDDAPDVESQRAENYSASESNETVKLVARGEKKQTNQ